MDDATGDVRLPARAWEYGSPASFEDFAWRSPAMGRVVAEARRIAQGDSWVFLTGETGTGKDLLARAIHDGSSRRDKPFVALNCGAIPAWRVEVEFLGHTKGAYHGATRANRGRLEEADGGALYLDHVTALDPNSQDALFRIFEKRSLRRVGGLKASPLNVRILTATNEDIQSQVAAGRFHQDLYRRLSVAAVHMPALRERPEDIPLLLDFFLGVFTRRLDKSSRGFTEACLRFLCDYSWPGNVIELKHLVGQVAKVPSTELIDLKHLPNRWFSRRPGL